MYKYFLAVLLLITCAGCAPLTTATVEPFTVPVQALPTEKKEPNRCVQATRQQIAALQAGIRAGEQAVDITGNVWTVKSNNFENVWLISTRLSGPGIQSEEAIGVWAVFGHPESPGAIYSVDGFAKSLTDFPDGAAGAQITMSTDGAEQAKDCVVTFN